MTPEEMPAPQLCLLRQAAGPSLRRRLRGHQGTSRSDEKCDGAQKRNKRHRAYARDQEDDPDHQCAHCQHSMQKGLLGPAAPLPQRTRAQLGGFLRHIRSCLLYGDSTRRGQAVKGRVYLAARPRFAHPVRRLGALIGRDPTFCKRLFEQADCRNSILRRDPALSRRRTGRELRKTRVHKDLRDLIRRFGNFHGRANPQARFLIDMPHRLVHFETPVSILAIGIGRAKFPAFASATPCLQPFDSVKHRANTLIET